MPHGQSAFSIGLEHILENLLGSLVPERVLIAHAAIESPLRRLVAGRGEMDGAELLIGLVLAESRRYK